MSEATPPSETPAKSADNKKSYGRGFLVGLIPLGLVVTLNAVVAGIDSGSLSFLGGDDPWGLASMGSALFGLTLWPLIAFIQTRSSRASRKGRRFGLGILLGAGLGGLLIFGICNQQLNNI